MACLQIYHELLSLATFLRVHSNSKQLSYLYWQNSYPNLKTIYHIKQKFFLWTKLLESLLLAKYLISVAATLRKLAYRIPPCYCFCKFHSSVKYIFLYAISKISRNSEVTQEILTWTNKYEHGITKSTSLYFLKENKSNEY